MPWYGTENMYLERYQLICIYKKKSVVESLELETFGDHQYPVNISCKRSIDIQYDRPIACTTEGW